MNLCVELDVVYFVDPHALAYLPGLASVAEKQACSRVYLVT
jgi:hypothetical protein